MRSIRLAAVLAAVLVLVPLAAHAEPPPDDVAYDENGAFLDLGPIRVPDQFLPGVGFLTFDPRTAACLEPGTWQIDVFQSVTNSWAQSDAVRDALGERDRRQFTLAELRGIAPERAIYHVDGEIYRTSIALRRGFANGWEVSVDVPILDFRGGFGDSIIEDFHDAFGFSQSGRLGVPKSDYLFYVRDENGRETFRNGDPGADLGDVVLTVKGPLSSSERWRLALAGSVKAPTGDEDALFSSGATDGGLRLLATRFLGRSWALHMGVGLRYLGEHEVLGIGAQVVGSTFVSAEIALGRTTAAVVQVTIKQSPYEELGADGLDAIAYLVDFGFEQALNENLVFSLSISENFETLSASSDVGAHLGLIYTF